MGNFLGCMFGAAFFAFGILQLAAGYAGIQNEFGTLWAFLALFLAFGRFTLPIMVGCYFCAHNIWGWNWFLSAFFAAPGLLFMIPAIFGSAVDGIRRR